MKPEIKKEKWPNGQRKSETPFVNGKIHGLEKWWYENGQKERETTYVNGQKHGVLKRWRENGQKDSQVPYINGQRHGLAQWWHNDGSLKYSGKRHQGQMVWGIHFPSTKQIPVDAKVELFFHPTPELK